MYEMDSMKAFNSAVGRNRYQTENERAQTAGAKSSKNFNNSNLNMREKVQKERLYSSGNPLRMIKNYKTKGATDQGSMSFKSNASTKDIHNEEQQRFNHIMNEPIEYLLHNMG